MDNAEVARAGLNQKIKANGLSCVDPIRMGIEPIMDEQIRCSGR